MKNIQMLYTIPNVARALILVCLVSFCLYAFPPDASAMQASLTIPQDWGASQTATRKATPSTPAPATPAESTMLIPNGHVIVGPGTVDPRTYIERRSTSGSHYSIKSPVAGIVEYLFKARSFFAAGFPLLRIYDASLLPDINNAEAAAKRYLDRPVTILGARRDIQNFPEPTPAQVARIMTPTPKPVAQLKPKSASSAGIARIEKTQRLVGDTPETTSAPQDEAVPAQPVVDTDALVRRIAAQKTDIDGLTNEAARLDSRIADLKERLAKADAEVDARQGLFEKGILARVKVDQARAEKASIESDIAQLRSERSLAERSADVSRQKLQKLEDELHAALTAPAPVQRPARVAAHPTIARSVSQPAASSGLPVPSRQKVSALSAATTPAQLREQPDTKRAREMVASINRLTQHENTRSISIPAMPQALTNLAQPRWDSVMAPTAGIVVDQLVAPGEKVEAGTELLRVANTQWARIYADLDPERLGEYRQGSPVVILFDEYPGTRFEGWINAITPSPDGMSLRAEIYTICTEGYFGADAYATLQWLAQAAPLDMDHSDTQLQPITRQRPATYVGTPDVYAMMPVVPGDFGPGNATVEERVAGQFVGSLQVAQLTPGTSEEASSAKNKERLKKLANWRRTFTEGMTTSLFGNQVVLTYPASGPSKDAIEKMATGRVTHQPNRCARTMREALGWGLGDAADWAVRLPDRGYKVREDGLCRPGDILVWPFTYGSRHTQHIGFSVMQGGRLMLLSNLSGDLGTTEIMPGYLAFYKPAGNDNRQASTAR